MQPFDIKSFSEIEIKNFSWGTEQDDYKSIRTLIIKILNEWKIYNESEKFDVILSQVIKALTEYITIFYDIEKVRYKSNVIFDNSGNKFVKNILDNKEIFEIYNYDLELKRLPKYQINYSISKLYLKFGSLFNNKLLVSKNEIIQNFLDENRAIYLPPVYFLKITEKIIKKNPKVTILSKQICEALINFNRIFEKINSNNIENIINIYLNRLEADIQKLNSMKSIFNSYKILITGTGDQYFNQLTSFFSNINYIPNYRFDHGGEKSFFIDREFWNSEIQFINNYYTYSEKIINSYKKIFAENEISFSGKFKKIKSKLLEKISQNNKFNLYNDSNTLIYVQQAFVGNSRNVDSKLNDPLLYYWQYNLLHNLKKRGYNVIFKTHPKGIHNLNNLYKETFKTTDKSLSDLFDRGDIFIFDSVGAAFIETLVANRKVILIDNQVRKVHKEQFEHMMNYATVVKGYWKNNLPMVDFDDLCHQIEILKNKSQNLTSTFYNNFYS